MIDYAVLANEITTDPETYGYAAPLAAGNDSAIAALLNKLRDGTDGETAISIKRADVSSSEIFHAIAVADLVNQPGASQLEWFNALLHLQTPIRLLNDDGSATPVRANVIALFKAGTPSLSRLAALETRFGSRAEQLFGTGVVVTANDVAQALIAAGQR